MIYVATSFVGKAEPLDQPRFCFHSAAATATATNSASGADPQWVQDGETWSQWKANASGVTLTLTFGSAQTIDYIGIAAHDLDLAGSSFDVQVDTGAGFGNIAGLTGITPTDDGAIVCLFAPVSADAIRIVITGSSAPTIGIFQAGQAMELPRRCRYTALPISESEQTTYRHAQAVKGAVLGRAVEAAELRFAIEIDNLPETFRTASGVASWKSLTTHIRDVGPFFVASRPSKYADDVAYGFASERPRFDRTKPNSAVSGSVSLNFLGYKRA